MKQAEDMTIMEYLEAIDSRQAELEAVNDLLERLYLRLYLIDNGNANKTYYELNENEILKLKTMSEINNVKRRASGLQAEFTTMYHYLVTKVNTMKQTLYSVSQ